ncbi:MAG: methyltransferase domain-containing protein [Phycisphaeraceae bacterium]|nr:methyltransferase domain-containing protein [Phycisphaeraceae bacterium]
MNRQSPWQLRMFQKTLKKRQRLSVLSRLLGPIQSQERCLLVTCGDNNGAMNWHLRELGGQWSWADLEEKSIKEMSELLGQPVHHGKVDNLGFSDAQFDRVVVIDAHEHVKDPLALTAELRRITRPGGQILITTPGGDQRKLANRIKQKLGMTKEHYGHVRDGFTPAELKDVLVRSQLHPTGARTFSRFFTEAAELGINYAYVKKLARRSQTPVEQGTIAPATSAQLKSVAKAYRMYALIFPFVWLWSRLDLLLFFTAGYVTVVNSRRPPE